MSSKIAAAIALSIEGSFQKTIAATSARTGATQLMMRRLRFRFSIGPNSLRETITETPYPLTVPYTRRDPPRSSTPRCPCLPGCRAPAPRCREPKPLFHVSLRFSDHSTRRAHSVPHFNGTCLSSVRGTDQPNPHHIAKSGRYTIRRSITHSSNRPLCVRRPPRRSQHTRSGPLATAETLSYYTPALA